MSEFKLARDLISKIGSESIHIMNDRLHSSEFTTTIDTGSYILNGLISADLFGGIQDNKITCLSGEEQTGKTYFALSIASTFMSQFENSILYYMDTESAVTVDMMESRGIDPNRVIYSEPETVEKMIQDVSRFLNAYSEIEEVNRPRCLMILDSLGNLASQKEMSSANSDEMAADMGARAKMLKAFFRMMTVRLGKAHIPFLFTNHIYQSIGAYGDPRRQGGGKGPEYAASTILFLSKKKERDKTTGEQTGSIITVETKKSRFTKTGRKVEVLIDFEKGLDRYYGLLPFALSSGVFQKTPRQIEIDGKRIFEKELNTSPEQYYTKDVLERLNKHIHKEFMLGSGSSILDTEETHANEN